MKYHTLFDDPQATAAILYTAGHAMRRDNIKAFPYNFAWAWLNDLPQFEIQASLGDRRMVVNYNGERVMTTFNTGEVDLYQRGAWETAASAFISETIRAGALDRAEVENYINRTAEARITELVWMNELLDGQPLREARP